MKKLSLVVISMLLTAFFLVGAIPSYAKNTDFSSAVVNGDGILDEDEADKIYTALCEAESKTDVTFLVAVYSSEKYIPSGMETVEGCGLDPYSDDVVLFIVEVGQVNYYELFTYGVADTVITQSAAEKILDDDIFTSIKSGDLYGGITAFIGRAISAIRAYRRNLVLIILAVALVAAGASVGAVIISYKKKLKSPIYPLTDYADLTLTERSDVFLGKTVTKVRISSQSDGGGHSGKSGGGSGSRGRR